MSIFQFFCSVDIWFFWVLHKLLYWSTLWNPSCRETQSLWSTCSLPSLPPLPPLPRRKAGHSAVRDYFDTVPFQSVFVQLAHVLIPVNLVYILMTDKIARCRHTCSCLREEIKNLAWMTKFLHGHSTWYLAKLLKNFTDSILTRDLRNFSSGPSTFLPQTLLWSKIQCHSFSYHPVCP